MIDKGGGITDQRVEKELLTVSAVLMEAFQKAPGCLALSWAGVFGAYMARTITPEEDDHIVMAFRESLRGVREHQRRKEALDAEL